MFDVKQTNDTLILKCRLEWKAATAARIQNAIDAMDFSGHRKAVIECAEISEMDTAGAWLLGKLVKSLKENDIYPTIHCLKPSYQELLEEVSRTPCPLPLSEKKPVLTLVLWNTGKFSHLFLLNALEILDFIGHIAFSVYRTCIKPSRFRLRSTIYHMEKSGLDALPIVGLISFLTGVVLVYQGAGQLRRFGAEIFTVDLLAVSALREICILLTAIVVAGRSGSAFTAQIGFMKLNQETDALWVLGLSVFEFLVIPRMVALLITLPLLVFFSDIMALLGGSIMCRIHLGLGFDQFFHHLQLSIKPWTFWSGMVKAPVFAVVIAIVGCMEGLRVHGGADNVGTQTTRSVVESIFLVIVLDAAFSIMFSILGI